MDWYVLSFINLLYNLLNSNCLYYIAVSCNSSLEDGSSQGQTGQTHSAGPEAERRPCLNLTPIQGPLEEGGSGVILELV